jgi:hypothetical protein
MGLIRTMGGFCFIECDTRNCTKKVEHVDEKLLRELAVLCGWERRGNQWICPDCAEIPSKGPGKTSRARQKTRISSKR